MQFNSTLPHGASGIYTIWSDDGIPHDSKTWNWHEQSMQAPESSIPSEMVRNVVIPTVTMFKPETESANGTAVIIAPGGAFHFLMMDHEGYDVARWLTERGITAFVLKYRVQHTPENDEDMPAFLEDLGKKLPHVSQTEVNPPMSYLPAQEARLWGEEDGRQAIRFLRQNATDLDIDPNQLALWVSRLVAGLQSILHWNMTP